MPDMMPKVRWLHEKRGQLKKKFWIEVDGGINKDTTPIAVGAGADALVAGNAIFAAPRPAQALKDLRHRAAVPAF
jgi:ribulose-phosphate 3-epimerase